MIRKIETNKEREASLELALKVFMEFEAPDYSEEGIEEFKSALKNPEYIDNLICYGAYREGILVGMIATRKEGSHVALFFVDKEFQHQGIGRKLFEVVKADNTKDFLTVNAAPYALPVYHALGFVATGSEQIDNGVRFTPMEYRETL